MTLATGTRDHWLCGCPLLLNWPENSEAPAPSACAGWVPPLTAGEPSAWLPPKAAGDCEDLAR